MNMDSNHNVAKEEQGSQSFQSSTVSQSEKETLGAGKYQMSMNLNVLNHLGMNLYSNIPAVISEAVANSYDADAEVVRINVGDGEIIIEDDGHGMTLEDINTKFLMVGYQKRINNEEKSPRHNRPVMGRKGIGKLSLFSIANEIEIHSTRLNSESGHQETNGFILRKSDIIEQIKKKAHGGVYHPQEVNSSTIKIEKGTKITLRQLKKNVNKTENALRRRLAKRFSVIGPSHHFEIIVNEEPITLEDRDYFSKLQYIWYVGEKDQAIANRFSFKRDTVYSGNLDDGTGYKITGWVGAVRSAGDLKEDNVNNNKISIMCRGKMAQEDILESFNEGGIYATYLIGELHADFLDLDTEEDIATSSRQKINEDDPRYEALQKHLVKLLKEIQRVWGDWRKDDAETEALERAEAVSPILKEWFDDLKGETAKRHAKTLFASIENMHFDKADFGKKKELYKHGVLAFEKMRLRDNLQALEKLTNPDHLALAPIFNSIDDIEASLYYDIALQRVGVIKEFQSIVDTNQKERVLQQHLFDHLWLLDPSWERATNINPHLEQNVKKAFGDIEVSLTEEEKRGRVDIRYQTTAGRHIIVELKRYRPGYKLTRHTLAAQADKYRSALEKCLEVTGNGNQPIEIIIVLGEMLNTDSKERQRDEDALAASNARIVYYDELIARSLESYATYLEKQKAASRLQSLLDRL